jgi:hypothetical protein
MDERLAEQILDALGNLDGRLRQVEEHVRMDSGKEWQRSNWWGWVSPTLPPAKAVQVHAGTVWYWSSIAATGNPAQVSEQTFSLAAVGAFANADYYTWAVLLADPLSSPAALGLYESGLESENADACEASFWANVTSAGLYVNYVPLAAIILKNDGNAGVAGAIENVTRADRTQSYLYLPDFRPWLHTHISQGPG